MKSIPAELRPKLFYFSHSFFNSISFNILVGNLLILYAISLGATPIVIGILSSMNFFGLVTPVLGRLFIAKLGAVKQFALFWFLRYLAMIPATLLFLPYFQTRQTTTFGVLILCVFGFSLFKGIALAGNKAVLGEVAGKSHAASFMSIASTIGTSASIITGIVTAFIIRNDPSPEIYASIFVVGILAGFCSAFSLSRLPEPKMKQGAYHVKLGESLKKAIKLKMMRRYFTVFSIMNLAFTVASAFIIVFYKDYYMQTDSNAMLLTVLSGVGAIVTINVVKKYIDKRGSKKIILLTSIGKLFLLVLLIIAPAIKLPAYAFVFIAFVNFFNGAMDGGRIMFRDIYFITIVKPEDRVNFSILASVGFGISGIIGSSTGGFILQSITDAGLPSLAGYRTIFIVSFVLYVIGILLATTLKSVVYGQKVDLH